ncbi:retrovirus-related pol polyprotein from transposon TNT 1-94 [Tanacetum coccineum]
MWEHSPIKGWIMMENKRHDELMIDNHWMVNLLKEVLMIDELSIVETDKFDNETGSSDGLQPKQADLSCVHALNEPHLHEIHVVPSADIANITRKQKIFKTLNLDESRSPDYNQFSDLEENSKEEVAETMAKTMEQYMSKTRADYGSGIARPKNDDKDHFELKGYFLNELRDNTFSGSDHGDANEHTEKVLEIVDLFYVPNITQDQEVILFYMGLDVPTRQILDSKGAIPTKTATDAKKGSYGLQCLDAYSYGATHVDDSLPLKEKDPGSFTLPCYINNVCFENALADLGASVSVMPLPTYLNLGLGELTHTKLTVELADRTVKRPKRIAENVLVGICKFIFPIDFIILDMPEDVKVPLILGRPFLSTAHAKIDVLRECMKLDLEARLMGETLVFNRSLDPLCGDYVELNDLNVPLELRRDQVDDLMPTIEEGEWKIWMATEIKTWEMSFLENHSARLHVWKQEGLSIWCILDLAGKEVDNVGEVSNIWNHMCLVVMLILADKLPEVIDYKTQGTNGCTKLPQTDALKNTSNFSKDLKSLEPASKMQLKLLAEKMQVITRGLSTLTGEK